MCSNCKDVAKGCRPKLHEPKFCPLLRASYCSVCCSKGHYTSCCPNKTALEFRQPQFVEQLIPFSKLQEYGITTQTILPTFQEPPPEFECPISHELMEDPVIACPAGHVFNRKDIELWIKTKQNCPVCRGPVSPLVPNVYLKTEIQNWLQVHSDTYKKYHLEAVLEVEDSKEAMRNLLMNLNSGKPLPNGMDNVRRSLQAVATEMKRKLVFIPVRKEDAKSHDKKSDKKAKKAKTTA